MFTMPSLVFDELGMRRNFKPSLLMADIMFWLKRRLVSSSFECRASSSAMGLADQDATAWASFLGIKSTLERIWSWGWKKRL